MLSNFEKVGSLSAANLEQNKAVIYEINNLIPDTVYYVKVNAQNELGEGYNHDYPFMIRTLSYSTNSDHLNLYSLYVWGFDNNSQLGLLDN